MTGLHLLLAAGFLFFVMGAAAFNRRTRAREEEKADHIISQYFED